MLRKIRISTRMMERLVTAPFDTTMTSLSRGDLVELRGFGVFSVGKREARARRPPLGRMCERAKMAISVHSSHRLHTTVVQTWLLSPLFDI